MKRQPKRVRASWPPVWNVKRVRLVGDPMPYNNGTYTKLSREERGVEVSKCKR